MSRNKQVIKITPRVYDRLADIKQKRGMTSFNDAVLYLLIKTKEI